MYMNVDFGYHPRESGTKFMICHYNNPFEGPSLDFYYITNCTILPTLLHCTGKFFSTLLKESA